VLESEEETGDEGGRDGEEEVESEALVFVMPHPAFVPDGG